MLRGACLLLLAVGAVVQPLVRGQEEEGSSCNLRNSRGVCRLIDRCEPVYEELLSGRRPEMVCGYEGSLPIVCCPTTDNSPMPQTTPSVPIWSRQPNTRRPPTSRPIPRPTTRPTPNPNNPFLNSLRTCERMCLQYAKSVYTLVQPPVLAGGDRQLVNVSLCAIQSKRLIVGGTKADPKEFPHMAAIGYNSPSGIVWNCGGTLISERFVLTAAHCTNTVQWGNAEWVRVGDLNLRSTRDDARPQDRRIIERIRHPNYRRPPQYNDIALLRLQSSVTFDAYVRPACLSISPTVRAGTRAVATGWGVVDWFDESGSDDLLKVTLPVVGHAQCNAAFRDDQTRLPNGINDNTQLCAGQEGRDTCQGDSGGPLVVYSARAGCMYDVLGVTSFGKLCGSVTPGVYTRVYYYLSWIESIVWPGLG